MHFCCFAVVYANGPIDSWNAHHSSRICTENMKWLNGIEEVQKQKPIHTSTQRLMIRTEYSIGMQLSKPFKRITTEWERKITWQTHKANSWTKIIFWSCLVPFRFVLFLMLLFFIQTVSFFLLILGLIIKCGCYFYYCSILHLKTKQKKKQSKMHSSFANETKQGTRFIRIRIRIYTKCFP